MEQNTSNNSSPPSKKSKLEQEENLQPETTSNQTASTAENLTAAKCESNQQPSNLTTAENLR